MPPKKPNRKPEDVVESVKESAVKWLDLQFVDLVGGLQHITVPSDTVKEDDFKEGIGKLDGSSIKGFKEVQESDMVLYPDPTTYNLLPWYGPEHRTARLIVNVHEGGSQERFTRDSRFLAEKAARFAADNGWDTSYWGPELEFFVFDGVRMLPSPDAVRNPWSGAGYEILSSEAPWSRDATKPPIRFKEGYYPAPPADTLVDFRNEAGRTLIEDFGIPLEAHHHEVATAGQGEINLRYDELVPMADKVVTYKYVLRNVAARMGKLCTFMPKPIYGDNASGMHVHQSLWNKGKNTFFDPKDKYAELSQTGRYYIGGLLEHARALCAFTNPTTNSYRRLVPGYEAPVFIAWSRHNRSANVRVPIYYRGVEHAKRVEYRTPDPSCNIYLAFAAMVTAGIDGIKRKIDPGSPVDEDIYHLSAAKRKEYGIRELPGSLKEAVDYLLTDYMFLKGVFTQDVIDTYAEIKLGEHLQTSLRPSPYEFYAYLDA